VFVDLFLIYEIISLTFLSDNYQDKYQVGEKRRERRERERDPGEIERERERDPGEMREEIGETAITHRHA